MSYDEPSQIKVEIETDAKRTQVAIIFTSNEPMDTEEIYQALATLINSHIDAKKEQECAH